jgi:hypothetical protein
MPLEKSPYHEPRFALEILSAKEEQLRQSIAPEMRKLYARVWEKAMGLAMAIAWNENPKNPVVRFEWIEWAIHHEFDLVKNNLEPLVRKEMLKARKGRGLTHNERKKMEKKRINDFD